MVCKIKDREARPITVQLHINGTPLTMEVDTGAAVSIISAQTHKKFFPKASLQQTSIKLRTYMDEAMPVLGELAVDVTYQGNTYARTLYVVQGNGPSLLGSHVASVLQYLCRSSVNGLLLIECMCLWTRPTSQGGSLVCGSTSSCKTEVWWWQAQFSF